MWTIRIFFDGDAADPAVYPLKSCSIPRCVGAAGTHAQQKATVSISGPTVSLSLKLVGRKEQTKAEIYEGTAIRFTGLIDTDWDFDAKGRLIESVSLTVMDYSGKLKIGVFGKDVAPENARLVRGPQRWQNYAVCDPARQDTSIVHQILKLAAGFLGITIPVKCDATCTTRLDYFQLEQNPDLKTQLEQLLTEFRLDYIFDADNSIRIISTDSNGEPVATVTDFRNSLRGSGSVYKPKSIKATWRKYERRVGEKIGEGYHKSDSVNSRSVEYGQDVTWSLPDGANLDGWEIVSIENLNPGSTWTETGVTHPRIDGASAKITSYDLEGCHIVMERHGACAKGYIRARITADIVIRYNKTKELYSNPGTTQESLTLLHHHQLSSSDGIEGATEYAMYYEAMKRKASTTYTFSSLSEYAPGAIVTLSESSVTGISAKVRILEQTLDPLTGIYKYKAEGAGDLDLKEAITKAETSEDHPVYGGDFLELSADLDESTGVVTVVAEGDAIDYYGLTPAWDLNGTSVTSTGSSVTFPVRDLALSGNVVTCTATLNGETVTATYDIDQLLSAPTLAIFTGDGSLFPAGSVNATLSAVLMRSGVDVALANESVFRWTRTSTDTVADATWNASAKAIGKRSVIITDPDLVDGNAVFSVSCTIGTTTYTSAGFSIVAVADGQSGWSNATCQLFKRSATAPAKYDGSALTYTFSTATLAGNKGSWSITIPSGSDPLYVIYAPAFGQGENDIVEPSDWTVPAILSENGTRGENGDTVATVMLYQRSASTPSKPTGVVTYNFLSGQVSNTGSWSNTVPASDGNPLWVITAVASVTGSSNVHEDTIQPSEWSTPSIMAKDGEQGPQGEQGIQGIQGIQGPQGEQGIPGKDGTNGKTSYFHIKYAPVQSPAASQMTETPSDYIGTYVDYTEADSTDPSKYTWARFKGVQGEQGIPGTNGANGETSYLHIAYANSADGSTGFTTNDAESAGKLYIGQYTDFVQADSSSPASYHWTKIKGETGATGPQGEKGEAGATGTSVTGIVEEYALSTSSTSVTGTWGTAVPTLTPTNRYLWNRSKTQYSNGTASGYTTPVVIGVYGDKGDTGGTGATGRGISSITEYYLASASPTAPSASDTGWSTSAQTPTEAKPYLWNKTVVTYTSGSPTTTIAMIGQSIKGNPGATGATGNGIKSVTVTYGVSSSASTQPTSWSSTIPAVAENQFLWTRTITDYTNDAVADTVTYTYAKQGKSGSAGTSVTISSIQYQAGTSATTAPTGTWSNNPVSVAQGQFLWTKTTFSDGKVAYGIARQGSDGKAGASGRGISSIAYRYATTTTQSQPAASSITSTTIPAMSKSAKYLWRKTVITYTDSTQDTSVELIAIYGDTGDSASIKDFDVDLSAKAFSVSPRGYTRTAQTIVATCTLIHVAVSAVAITWSSTSSQVTLTPSSDKTTCTISVAARVALLPFRISCAVTGIGLTKTFSVDVKAEPGDANVPVYLGTNWDTTNAYTPDNDPIWSGDYYLDTSTNTPMIASVASNGTIAYSAMQTGNPNTALIMGTVLSDILAQGSGVQSACVAVNAYFGAIAAKTGFIESLRSQVIQSANYSEDSSGNPVTGYKLDGPNNVIKAASMKAVGGMYRGISIEDGSMEITDGDTSIFKTVSGDNENVVSISANGLLKYYNINSYLDTSNVAENTENSTNCMFKGKTYQRYCRSTKTHNVQLLNYTNPYSPQGQNVYGQNIPIPDITYTVTIDNHCDSVSIICEQFYAYKRLKSDGSYEQTIRIVKELKCRIGNTVTVLKSSGDIYGDNTFSRTLTDVPAGAVITCTYSSQYYKYVVAGSDNQKYALEMPQDTFIVTGMAVHEEGYLYLLNFDYSVGAKIPLGKWYLATENQLVIGSHSSSATHTLCKDFLELLELYRSASVDAKYNSYYNDGTVSLTGLKTVLISSIDFTVKTTEGNYGYNANEYIKGVPQLEYHPVYELKGITALNLNASTGISQIGTDTKPFANTWTQNINNVPVSDSDNQVLNSGGSIVGAINQINRDLDDIGTIVTNTYGTGIKLRSGLIVNFGYGFYNSQTARVTYPIPFRTYGIPVANTYGVNKSGGWIPKMKSFSVTGFTYYKGFDDEKVVWIAIGY
ncbi:MAG: hypothetical protein PUH55_04785 [Spirochaetales bacterium]|nr:hypothetical protein [Spirochaetales bacterium]